jgi:transcriptional antiterminator NusG
MQEKDHWYILFVYNGKEQKVSADFSSQFKDEQVFPFVPTKDKVFKGGGKTKIEKELLFPGYVFIETKILPKKFLRLVEGYVKTSSDIIRVLRNSSDPNSDITVKEEERTAWMHLLGRTSNIEISIGFIENDKVTITHGPLMGQEGIIKKIDRHKRQTTIEMKFMGRVVEMRVALEVIGRT